MQGQARLRNHLDKWCSLPKDVSGLARGHGNSRRNPNFPFSMLLTLGTRSTSAMRSPHSSSRQLTSANQAVSSLSDTQTYTQPPPPEPSPQNHNQTWVSLSVAENYQLEEKWKPKGRFSSSRSVITPKPQVQSLFYQNNTPH